MTSVEYEDEVAECKLYTDASAIYSHRNAMEGREWLLIERPRRASDHRPYEHIAIVTRESILSRRFFFPVYIMARAREKKMHFG